jgi:hypothetical protein
MMFLNLQSFGEGLDSFVSTHLMKVGSGKLKKCIKNL